MHVSFVDHKYMYIPCFECYESVTGTSISQIERMWKREKEKTQPKRSLVSILLLLFVLLLSPLILPSSSFTLILQSVSVAGRYCILFLSRVGSPRGAPRTILLDVTSTLGLFLPLQDLRRSFVLVFRARMEKGLQMAAISACIDSWNWEDLLVPGGYIIPSFSITTRVCLNFYVDQFTLCDY